MCKSEPMVEDRASREVRDAKPRWGRDGRAHRAARAEADPPIPPPRAGGPRRISRAQPSRPRRAVASSTRSLAEDCTACAPSPWLESVPPIVPPSSFGGSARRRSARSEASHPRRDSAERVGCLQAWGRMTPLSWKHRPQPLARRLAARSTSIPSPLHRAVEDVSKRRGRGSCCCRSRAAPPVSTRRAHRSSLTQLRAAHPFRKP
mgnify:CR=1 FL=1